MQENYNDVEKQVSFFGYENIIFNIIKSVTLGMATYLMFSISKVDTYIAAILGCIFGIIPFFGLMYICNNRNGEDIIDLNKRLFGKIFGNVLNVILNVTFLLLSALVLFNVSQFIDTQYIPDTSPIYVKLLILLAVCYSASKGLSTITKVNQIVAFINLGMFILSIFGMASEVDISNVMPVLKDGSMPVIKSALIYMISSIAPLFLITIVSKNSICDKKYSYKSFLLFYIFSSLIIAVVIFSTISIQGIELVNLYRYPEYVALREFSLFTIIERIERTLSLQFVFNVIMFMVYSFYFVIESIKKMSNSKKDKSYLSWIIGALSLLIASNLFENEMDLNIFISKYLIIILLLGIFLPMAITFIGVVIDNIKNKNNIEKNSTKNFDLA